jgi:hypothetical protein
MFTLEVLQNFVWDVAMNFCQHEDDLVRLQYLDLTVVTQFIMNVFKEQVLVP